MESEWNPWGWSRVEKESKMWGWGLALGLSLGLHALLGLHERRPLPALSAPEPEAIDMVWLELPPDPEPVPAETPPPVAPAEEPQIAAVLRPAPARRTRRVPREAGALDAAGGASAAEGAVGMPQPSEPTDSGPAERPLDVEALRPSAVAAATFGPRLPTRAEREAALESAVQADLYQIANAANYDTVRPPPELQETGDGGYSYRGRLFEARISPEGEVTFDDAPNFAYSGLGGPDGSLGLGFSFDISAAAEQAAGNDPHAAERRWFMAQTRRVRDELAAAARARIQGRGLVRLRRQMQTIRDSGQSAEERRRRLFRLWDACEEDEVGALARAAIVEFLQTQDTGFGLRFPDEELRRLNAARVSREPFAPAAEP